MALLQCSEKREKQQVRKTEPKENKLSAPHFTRCNIPTPQCSQSMGCSSAPLMQEKPRGNQHLHSSKCASAAAPAPVPVQPCRNLV